MKLSKCLFAAAASLAMTGVAFADEPTPDPNAPPTDPPADPTAGGAAGADGNAAVTVGGAFSAETWPLEYTLRPQVLYKGGIEVSPRFNLAYAKVGDDSSTVTSLSVGGRYGVSDTLEILASYDGFILSGVDGIEFGDRVKGALTAGAGLGVAKGKLDAEVKAALTYDLGGETAAILAGVDVRFNLAPKMWVGTPVNRPGLVAFVKGFDDGMGGTVSPIFFRLPVAFAYQATPELAIQANTNLFNVAFNDAGKISTGGESVSFIFTDEGGGLPLDFDFIYALNHKMDVQANLGLGDVLNIGDVISVSAGVNIRL